MSSQFPFEHPTWNPTAERMEASIRAERLYQEAHIRALEDIKRMQAYGLTAVCMLNVALAFWLALFLFGT